MKIRNCGSNEDNVNLYETERKNLNRTLKVYIYVRLIYFGSG